jgi:hypothetical protein
MNAILFHSYATMHITPEEGSSYASFETNQKLESYTSLVSNVVRAFRPKRFVMTLMADEGGVVQMGENPLFTDSASNAKVVVPLMTASKSFHCDSDNNTKVLMKSKSCLGGGGGGGGGSMSTYKRRDIASIKVEEDVVCMMGNWVLEGN